jgi:hypothetical protein
MLAMFKPARHRRWTAWLAMWLLALSACLPVLAQAVVRAQGGADWLQVCTSTGMVWVNAQGEQRDAGDAPAPVSAVQCDWCLVQAGASGMPPADLSLGLSRDTAVAWTGLAPDDAVLAALRHPAQSRAPPFNA